MWQLAPKGEAYITYIFDIICTCIKFMIIKNEAICIHITRV